MFGLRSTSRGSELEKIIKELQSIFVKIQINLDVEENVKNRFRSLVIFNFKNQLILLKIDNNLVEEVTTLILNIFELYLQKDSINDFWNTFNIELHKLEELGNSESFVHNSGFDLKSIFLITHDNSEMKDVIRSIAKRITVVSSELVSQVSQRNVSRVDYYIKRIKDEFTHVFFLTLHSIGEYPELKKDIYNIYSYLDSITQIFKNIPNVSDKDIELFYSFNDKTTDFFNRFGGIVIGGVSIGYIVRGCCFANLLNIDLEQLQKEKIHK